MSANEKYTVELKERQWEFIQRMVKKYDLPDESKALRCLINFAFERNDLADDIFETIRCHDCG